MDFLQNPIRLLTVAERLRRKRAEEELKRLHQKELIRQKAEQNKSQTRLKLDCAFTTSEKRQVLRAAVRHR